MTLDQLTELDTAAMDRQFGECLAEEISRCNDLQALLELSHVLTIRISEIFHKRTDELDLQIAALGRSAID